ncbi:UDP-glucose dehydrogenase family protein [Demequina sp. SO4-13]|uniref:UDP-glucose dehydrogenase family protein n=1 Tax=Demequina sp. SO4-13 TaxID=3401027 RepID=UPI003AF49C76
MTDIIDQPMATPRPRLTVVGTGYLGATHAVSMASLGYEVLGVDVDQAKIDRLTRGEVPFHEPGLPEMLDEALASGNLRFTTSFDEAAEFGDVHFVCVGTPQLHGSHAANLAYVEAAFTAIAQRVRKSTLIVGKSTVPVGTAERLADMVAAAAPDPDLVEVAWNPEFLREGYAVQDTLHPDRLVFGVSSERAETSLRAAFEPVLEAGTPLVVADMKTAELVKVAANSFLATKISYINAMAEICEVTGADVNLLASALSYDDRIGARFLKPGLGFGGGCLPKDIRAFMHRAEELGVGHAVEFLHEVDEINARRRRRTVDLVRELAGGDLRGMRIACLGAAFKPNSDDIRDAPALDVADMLRAQAADVVVYDPEAMGNAREAYPQLDYAPTFAECVKGADVVVLLTEWARFREADPEMMGELVRHRAMVDGRHALDADAYRSAGWEYRALGRPAQPQTVRLVEDVKDQVAAMA